MTALEVPVLEGRVVDDAAPVDEPPLPGVYDWTAEEYHGDPLASWGGSVSSTTLRTILKPGGPALVQWERQHRTHRDPYDEGTVAHRMVLGSGGPVWVVDAVDWRTNAAKSARDAARKRGAAPVLRKTWAKLRRLAHAVQRHPVAGPLFDGRHGVPERSVLWIDERTGAYCRAMLDVFPHLESTGRPIAVDLKTTDHELDDRSLARAVLRYGYEQQAAHYLEGLRTLGLSDAGFLFVFVTKDPPHLVRVVELDDDALRRGWHRNRDALDLWDRCRDLGSWPGPPPGPDLLTLPAWALTREDEDL